MQAGVLFAVAAVLVVGVGLGSLPQRKESPPEVPDLNAAVPGALSGWSVREEPLGSTEALSSVTQKVLAMDAYSYKVYTRGDTTFSVYVAYWGTSAEAAPIVLAHLPDRCWTSSGMKSVEFRDETVLRGASGELPPAEWRLFETPTGEKIHVAYWLWFGGERFRFGRGMHGRFDDRPGFYRSNWLVQAGWILDNLFRGSREQYFVRCSANVPIDELLKDHGVERLFNSVVMIGARDIRR